MDKNELAEIRNKMLGFIFQQYNLLPKLTLLENVEVPLMYAGVPKAERHERAKLALELVGLSDKLKNRPNQLSGGQQQRASIARALVGEPAVILADEPTGALDSHTSREVLSLLQKIHEAGNTVVLITHDNSIAVQAQRIIRLKDGRVDELTLEMWDAILQSDLRGTFYATKCVLPYLQKNENGGSIINIGSMASCSGDLGSTPFT